MSENKANEESNEIKEMRDAIPELKETAFKNYHWALLKTLVISTGFLLIGGIIGVTTSQFVSLPSSPFEPSKIEQIAEALITPSVTMNGLFVTFVPVISLFYMEEIKEEQREMKEEWQRKKRNLKRTKI